MKYQRWQRLKKVSVLLVSFSFFAVACKKSKVKPRVDPIAPHEDPVGEPEPEQPVAERSADFGAGLGILNFRQLMATYSTLTGVSDGDSAVQAEYLKQLGSLPIAADAASISAAKISASTKLAAAFCDQMSTNDALLRQTFSLPLAELTALSAQDFSEALISGFYGEPTALQGNRTEDEATISDLVNILRQVQPDNGPLLSSSVFMGACSAIISSGEFTLY